MSKLRTLTACARANKRTKLRARCIKCVVFTKRTVETTRLFLHRMQVRRPPC